MSGDGRRVLFYEDISVKTQLPFDLNAFRPNAVLFGRTIRAADRVHRCLRQSLRRARFRCIGGDGDGRNRTRALDGVKQQFFLAADAGEQAREGAFGAAVLKALTDSSRAQPTAWPVDQDAVVTAVRPQFARAGQHPVQLVWTTAEGDVYGEQHAGELPASRFVNAAAYARQLPVKAVRHLAEIALGFAKLGDATPEGAEQRDELYDSLWVKSGRPLSKQDRSSPRRNTLRRSTPRVEMLHVVGAALQWNQEAQLAVDLGQLAANAEFTGELHRLALIQSVRGIVEQLPATDDEIRGEYVKTIRRLSDEPARERAATINEMLDELYQVTAVGDPQRPVWEFLMRLENVFRRRKPASTLSSPPRA